MDQDVRPGVGEVVLAEGGVGAHEVGIACAETTRWLKQPDGNSGPHDAGLTAANSRWTFHARNRVGKILGNKLQHLHCERRWAWKRAGWLS